MGLKDLLGMVAQSQQQSHLHKRPHVQAPVRHGRMFASASGSQALAELLNTPRFDKHVKGVRIPQGGYSTKPARPVGKGKSLPRSSGGFGGIVGALNQAGQIGNDVGNLSRRFNQAMQPQTARQRYLQGMDPSDDAQLKTFFDSIKQQESNDNYSAVGIPTHGGRALGAYQVMSSNIDNGNWDEEALGRSISSSEFLNDPALQDQIAQKKLAAYYRDYGAAGAAKAWYGGPGAAMRDSNGPQYGGPSINGYADSVTKKMQRYGN